MTEGPKTPYGLMSALCELELDLAHATPVVALRKAIRQVFRQAYDNRLCLDGIDAQQIESHDEDHYAKRPSVLLLVWCDDLDGCESYLIPHGAISATLLADIRMSHGLCFANSSDCTAVQLGAALRVLIAITGRDPHKFYDGWSHEFEDGSVGIDSASDLVEISGALREYFGDLGEHRVTEVVAVNKAC